MKYPKVIIKKNIPVVEVKPAPIEIKEENLITVDKFWFDKKIQIRDNDELADKSFYLDSQFNWQIVVDSEGAICLVPNKKE